MIKNFIKRRLSPAMRRRLREVERSTKDLAGEIRGELIEAKRLKSACIGKTHLLLNIGCGDLGQDGWINIDLSKTPKVFWWNLHNGLPIESGAVEHIHMEHFLEHLEYDVALGLIGECYRVLQPGGSMRIIVPDAAKYMRAYAFEDRHFFSQLDKLGGTAEPLPTPAAICNQMFHMGGDHKFGWDLETLRFVCLAAGFRVVNESKLNDVEARYRIDGQDWWRPLESLYVNVEK
jgi:predicted SAM-dependent methyltransferase